MLCQAAARTTHPATDDRSTEHLPLRARQLSTVATRLADSNDNFLPTLSIGLASLGNLVKFKRRRAELPK